MEQCQTLVVLVVLGPLGTVHGAISRSLNIIPDHHNLQHLQKQCFLDPVGFCIKSRLLSRQP